MRSTVVIQPKSPQPEAGRVLVPVPEEIAEEDLPEFMAHPEEPSPGDELFAVVETDHGKFLEEDIEIDPADEPPRLTHRLHGKQTWPPVLRAMRTGGEWPGDGQTTPLDEKTEEEYLEECKAQWKDISEVYNAMAMELLQLEELRKVEREEKATMVSSEDAKLVLRIGKECDKLEHRLKALNTVEENYNQVPKECQETLVTRSVTLEEVRGDLEQWKGALQAEYQSLIDHGAIRPLSNEEFMKVKETNEEVTTIPGMLVATLKPPCRKKARVVACGNYVQDSHNKQEVSAGGLDAIVTRSLVALASRKQWAIATADVKTAFLQAPRRATPGRATIISPPSVLRDAGVLQHGLGERWLVEKAIYGLVESPRDWATFRDAQLKKMSWVGENGQVVRVLPTAEPHLWEVKETKSNVVRAYLGIYVDGIMVIGERNVMEQVMQDLRRIFYMSPYEEVTEEHAVTFCGFEVAKRGEHYTLRQEKYVGELVQRRQVQGREHHPLPKIVEDSDEETKDPRIIKECQAIIGELQWLASRTRPDLCYSTSLVARMVHRRPAYALGLCHHMLRYLAAHQSHGLSYGKDDEEHILHVRADTSFAPPHEQFRSVQGVAVFHGSHLLFWTSSRQAFVTLSTAESELLGYTEGLQCGEAVGCLVNLLGFNTEKVLEGDSKAALCQVQSDGGSWRTRHLRLRAWKLREVMNDPASGWRSEHVPGCRLAADGLTKALQGQAHRKFIELLEMDVPTDELMQKKDVVRVKRLEGAQADLWHQVALMLATAGATMVLDASNQHLGVLMLVCSMVVKWWEGRKKCQEPQSQQKQQPLGFKKNEDPEKRNEKNPMKASKEADQDPSRTHESENGTQKDQDPERTRRSKSTSMVMYGEDDQPKSWASVAGGSVGRSPGLRAMRINPKDSKGSSDASAMAGDGSYATGGSAKQRGRRVLQDMQGKEAPRSNTTVNMVVNVYGGEVEQEVTLSTGTSSQSVLVGNIGRSVEEPVEEPMITTRGRRTVEEPVEEPMITTRSGLLGRSGLGEEHQDEEDPGFEQPWKLDWYALPPRSKSDRWEDLLRAKYGWMVRVHGAPRKLPFHPVHRSTPFEVEDLESQRITTIFNNEGAQVIQDQWMKAKELPIRSRWTGYTFFKLKAATEKSDRRTTTKTRATVPSKAAASSAASVSSDGSFEKIDS